MQNIRENLQEVCAALPEGTRLVAVSKFHPADCIQTAYDCGQRIFGESREQELQEKVKILPKDIQWHFIGHLQTNKLKMVLPYATMIQSVDSRHLLDAIEKACAAEGRCIDVLLEMHLGAEETKQGMPEEEIMDILFDAENYPHIRFRGLMGMATNTPDAATVEADFSRIDSYMAYLVDTFPELESFDQLSIGMSGDWPIAVRNGSTMVRIGTAIFGNRN